MANVQHKLRNHALYRLWAGIKTRCYNKNVPDYKNYGGRGVVMCEDWKNNFKLFYDWATTNGWQKGLQIDKDIKGSGLLYSPNDCCFVTRVENCNKRRSNHVFIIKGERKTIAEICRATGIKRATLEYRINTGLDIESCINRITKKGRYNKLTKIM